MNFIREEEEIFENDDEAFDIFSKIKMENDEEKRKEAYKKLRERKGRQVKIKILINNYKLVKNK